MLPNAPGAWEPWWNGKGRWLKGGAEVWLKSIKDGICAFEDGRVFTAFLTDAAQDERPAQGSEAAVRRAGDQWRRDNSSVGLK